MAFLRFLLLQIVDKRNTNKKIDDQTKERKLQGFTTYYTKYWFTLRFQKHTKIAPFLLLSFSTLSKNMRNSFDYSSNRRWNKVWRRASIFVTKQCWACKRWQHTVFLPFFIVCCFPNTKKNNRKKFSKMNTGWAT